MTTITTDLHIEFTEMLDDTVEYICREYSTRGDLVSGETLYKIMECWAAANLAEMSGECESR